MSRTTASEVGAVLSTYVRSGLYFAAVPAAIFIVVLTVFLAAYSWRWAQHANDRVFTSTSPDASFELTVSTHMLFRPFSAFHDAGTAVLVLRRSGSGHPIAETAIDLVEYDDVRLPKVSWSKEGIVVKLTEYHKEIKFDLPDT